MEGYKNLNQQAGNTFQSTNRILQFDLRLKSLKEQVKRRFHIPLGISKALIILKSEKKIPRMVAQVQMMDNLKSLRSSR